MPPEPTDGDDATLPRTPPTQLDATLGRKEAEAQQRPTDTGDGEARDVHLEAEVLNVSVEHLGRYTWQEPGSSGEAVAPEAAELGRGGIGRVLLARDRHLDREVAFKELLANRGASEATMRRFLREARITAGLEHPNIVPVYELAYRDDGTLYYTMRLVRGRTLAEALAERNTPDARLGLLGHVVDVCQAIAFAHSHGVIHRDLKPGNVMVGEFGETVVLDWGLAKHHDERGEAPAVGGPTGGDDAALTQDGSTLGTPAYMSPEQAAGDTEQINERSDVFALGVMLFELLTGQTPFGRAAPAAVITQVMRQPAPSVTSVWSEAPGELAAIVDRALQHQPEDRYPSARELAADLEAYQSGRRVAAYDYSAWTLVKRFVGRHKAAVAVAAIAAILLAVLGVVSLDRIVDERDRALTQRSAARAFASYMLYDIGEALEALPGSSPLREQLVTRALSYYETDAGEARTPPERRDLAMAWSKIALAALDLGKTDEAQRAVDRAESQVRALAGAEGYPAAQHQRDLQTVLRARAKLSWRSGDVGKASADVEEARAAGEAALATAPNDPTALRELAATYELVSDVQGERGSMEAAAAALDRVMVLQRQILTAEPGQPRALRGVTETLAKQAALAALGGRLDDAELRFRAAIEGCRERLATRPGHTPDKADLARHLASLAELKAEQLGHLAEARALYRAALPLSEDVSAADPGNATHQMDLAKRLGQLARSEQGLNAAAPAVDDYAGRAHGILERRVATDPSDAVARHRFGLSHRFLGQRAAAAGDWTRAAGHFERAKTLAQELIAADPDNVDAHQLLTSVQVDLGEVAEQAGDTGEAERLFRASVEAGEALRQRVPGNVQHPRDQAIVRTTLGVLAQRGGRVDDARSEYSHGLALRQEVARRAPDSTNATVELGRGYGYLAQLEHSVGNNAVALDLWDQELAISEVLWASAEEAQQKGRGGLLAVYRTRADYAHALGQSGRAAGYLRRMGELADELLTEWPDEIDFLAHAGLARAAAGEHLAQLAIVERVLELDPASAGVLADKVEVLTVLGHFAEVAGIADEAIARIRKMAPRAVPAIRAWVAAAHAMAGLPHSAAMIAREAAREARSYGSQPIFWGYQGVLRSFARFATRPWAAEVVELLRALDASLRVSGEAAADALDGFADALDDAAQ